MPGLASVGLGPCYVRRVLMLGWGGRGGIAHALTQRSQGSNPGAAMMNPTPRGKIQPHSKNPSRENSIPTGGRGCSTDNGQRTVDGGWVT